LNKEEKQTDVYHPAFAVKVHIDKQEKSTTQNNRFFNLKIKDTSEIINTILIV
jgi:hypothetical protein